MSAMPEESLLKLMSSALTMAIRGKLQEQPLRVGPATISVERAHVLADQVVVHATARGPLNIQARAGATILIEEVREDEAVLRLAMETGRGAAGRLIGGLIPTLMLRLEGMLRRRGIDGVEISGSRITVAYQPLLRSLLDESS